MEVGICAATRSSATAPAVRRVQLGFTLIEMMIVVALLAILTSLAAPALSTFVASQRNKTISFDLYSSMMFARSEAIKRRSTVTVEATGGAWNNGWTVKAGAVELRTQGALNGVDLTLTPVATTSFSYGMDGRVSAPTIVGTLASVVNPDQVGKRCFTFDATGVPRSFKLASGSTCS